MHITETIRVIEEMKNKSVLFLILAFGALSIAILIRLGVFQMRDAHFSVEAYFDRELSQPIRGGIAWGLVKPNQTLSKVMYVRNLGNVPTHIDLLVHYPPPENDTRKWFTLTWNYTGQELSVGEVIPLTLTLVTPQLQYPIDLTTEIAIVPAM